MNIFIECSIGELVDKITILKIKRNKCLDANKLLNIDYEYNRLNDILANIERQNIDSKNSLLTEIKDLLYNINTILWNLEDHIRLKTANNEFDSDFIDCARKIHISNDERYCLKNRLNNLFDSNIKEEKLYNHYIKNNIDSIDKINSIDSIDNIDSINSDIDNQDNNVDFQKYLYAIKLYEVGNYKETYLVLSDLCNKYITNHISNFTAKIVIAYTVISCSLHTQHKFLNYLDYIMCNIDNILSNKDEIIHAKMTYARHLLNNKHYLSYNSKLNLVNRVNVFDYIKLLQPVNAVSNDYIISPDTISFFSNQNNSESLLIYFSGGLGDKIMFARFIKAIANKYSNNTIIVLIDDSLFWIFKEIYRLIKNIIPIKYSDRGLLKKFDHHTSLTLLHYYLNLEFRDIYIDYYLDNPLLINLDFQKNRLDTIIDRNRFNIIINWKGQDNPLDKFTRAIELETLVVFINKIDKTCSPDKKINWISIQKNVSQEEAIILNKYNIKNVGASIDTYGDGFRDTLTILLNSHLVITTDTSIAHLAATANVKTWLLLTSAHEWRWQRDDANISPWYPQIKFFQQDILHDWSNVIDSLYTNITEFMK